MESGRFWRDWYTFVVYYRSFHIGSKHIFLMDWLRLDDGVASWKVVYILVRYIVASNLKSMFVDRSIWMEVVNWTGEAKYGMILKILNITIPRTFWFRHLLLAFWMIKWTGCFFFCIMLRCNNSKKKHASSSWSI